MSKRKILATFAGGLALSFALNARWLNSWRLDMDSLNASAVFYLGRVDLVRMLRWLASSKAIFSSYEPVANFSYWLIYGPLKGQGPQGFRLFEIVLQAANALLVGGLAARWVTRYRWAALAGLLYLLHPMHENWSCLGVPHYLATFFILCGLLLHSGPWNANVGRRTAGLCALYFLAAFSKESGALLPLFLLCFDAAASLSAPSRSDFWKRRLIPYLGLSAVALFYVWVRREQLHVVSPGQAADAGRRLWEALEASRYAAVFPAALLAALLARKHASASHFARVAFCAAWFTVAVLPFLGLIPVKLPEHVQGVAMRYLFLPMAGLAWLVAVTLDLCERRWGSAWAVVLALLSLAPSLQGLSRLKPNRQEELTAIERALAQCENQVRPNWTCVQAAISLPLVRREAPEAFERLRKTLNGFWPPQRAEAFLDFFAGQPFDGSAPKWRCLSQAMLEQGDLENCVRANRAFENGLKSLREERYAAADAAFDAATKSWPSFTEAFFQKARALSSDHDGEGATRSYDLALRTPMAYYLLSTLTARFCASPKDDSCRFLDRTRMHQEIDLFRATDRAWLGVSPARDTPSTSQLRRWTEYKPRDPDLWLDLASAASAEGKRDLVLKALSRAEGLPPDRDRLKRMARLYQNAQDDQAAVRVLNRLVKDFPFDAQSLNDRAVARLLLKDEAAALRDLERTISTDPDFLSAYLTLGGVHASRGRKAKALKVYEAALKRPVRQGEPTGIRRLIGEERDKILQLKSGAAAGSLTSGA